MARIADAGGRMGLSVVVAASLFMAAAASVSAAAGSAAVLRLARSADGLEFTGAGLFARDAASPSLLHLSSGQILAVFDRQPGSELCVCQSRDGGVSWSPARPIRLRGAGERGLQTTHGALVQVSPRLVRLYFVARALGREEGDAFIASAVTRNGLDYELERQVRVDARGVADPHPIALKTGSLTHLFLSAGPSADRPERGKGGLLHLVSTDGQRFRPAPEAQPRVMAGSVVDLGNGTLRMYASGDEGVISLTARERGGWEPEAGWRLRDAAQPAVTTLADGSFLMVYSVTSAQETGGAALVAVAEANDAAAQNAAPSAQPAGSTAGLEGWEPFASTGPAEGAEESAGELAAAPPEVVLPPVEDLVAPLPDWDEPVDYHEWLRQKFPLPVEGNAHDAYATILHMPGESGPKPGWPEKIDDMFNGDYSGPPFPWNPQQYPNWEASNQSMQSLLGSFREASLLERYVDPLSFTPAQIAKAPNGRPLLMEILLPSLADHRKLVRATLADGWRAQNGQVVPERMLTDIETVLRAGSHYQEGPTLIHRLVGIAEQSAAQATARQALVQVPFAPEQLETGLRILQQHDRGPVDPAGWVPCEAAAAMDVTQRLLEPPQPGAGPNRSPFDFLFPGSNAGSSDFGELAEFRGLGPEGALKAAEAFQEFYAKMASAIRTGYPQVRGRDVEALSDQYAKTNSLTKAFVPALSRAYVMSVRNEAGRRGTQLAWAVNLFRARNGTWPASLDELPADGSKMRIDPFTGTSFAYRLTEQGPIIYSCSEDGVDNGGTHSKRWGDVESVKQAGGSDDFVFWPPQN